MTEKTLPKTIGITTRDARELEADIHSSAAPKVAVLISSGIGFPPIRSWCPTENDSFPLKQTGAKMAENITLNTVERVTTLTISRPAKRNAITQDMYAAMADALETYTRSDDSRAFVITGAEDYFTA